MYKLFVAQSRCYLPSIIIDDRSRNYLLVESSILENSTILTDYYIIAFGNNLESYISRFNYSLTECDITFLKTCLEGTHPLSQSIIKFLQHQDNQVCLERLGDIELLEAIERLRLLCI